MKRKTSSIFLLLTFLIILGHEMIPHHHHENQKFSFLSSKAKKEKHSHYYNAHHDDHHHKHHHKHHHESHSHDSKNSEKEKHDHDFPQHFHAADISVFVRINFTGKTIEIKDVSYILPAYYNQKDLYTPPIRRLKQFINHSESIKSSYKPGANALRAPPSIA